MTVSNRLGITELSASQVDRSVTINEAIAKLEAGATFFAAIQVLLNAPPGSPADGDLYVVGTAGTGAWSGHNENVAIYYNAAWLFFVPIEGMFAWDQTSNTLKRYDGADWVAYTVGAGGIADGDYGDITVSSSGSVWTIDNPGVSSSRQIISGAGLTGGGDLSADRTLAVGAGTGITVNADDVAIDKASDAEVRSAASNQVLTSDLIESASALVTLTDGANISLDWDAGINRSLTIGGNRTLDNPTNGQPGTWRTIIVTQDGTGTRTLAYGNQYKFPGGTEPVLTTAAGSVDVLNILCVTSSNFYVFSANDMKV